MAHTAEEVTEESWDDRASKPVFKSGKGSMSASRSDDVKVDLRLDAVDVDALRRDIAASVAKIKNAEEEAKPLSGETWPALLNLMKEALARSFTGEFDGMVAAYREMLERRAASGDDEAVSRALTKVKIQTEILASVSMVDQAEACTLLGLSTTNPSATLGRLESKGKILRYDWRGKAAYPLFQFDVSERRIHPAIHKLIEMQTDDWGGKMALLHWLTRPNRSLGGAKPCDSLSEDAVLRSFAAEVAEPLNG